MLCKYRQSNSPAKYVMISSIDQEINWKYKNSIYILSNSDPNW